MGGRAASTGRRSRPEGVTFQRGFDGAKRREPEVGSTRAPFEFNVVELSAEGQALQQIKDKGYADKYRTLGQPIHLIGVEFSRASRNIVRFEVG